MLDYNIFQLVYLDIRRPFIFQFSSALHVNIKKTHLVLAGVLQHLLVNDIVHDLEPLDRLLLHDSDVLLFQRHRPERIVEVEETFLGHSQETSDVFVVRQSGAQSDQSDLLLSRFNVTDCSKVNQ